jgi:hypothetical protein
MTCRSEEGQVLTYCHVLRRHVLRRQNRRCPRRRRRSARRRSARQRAMTTVTESMAMTMAMLTVAAAVESEPVAAG